MIYVVLIVARFRAGWGGRRGRLAGHRGLRDRGLHLRLGDADARGSGGRTVIVVVGLSHQTAPLEIREALAFPKERLGDALAKVREETGLSEAMILSTCNRVEIYGRAPEPRAETVGEFLARYHDQPIDDLEKYLYRHEGDAAVRHAFRVAASLESMVLGESQILGQVKQAYEAAEEAGSLGPVLNALKNRTYGSAKRARTETAIGRNAVSVSHVAVELARKIFGDLKDRAVLLVGAGKMSEVAARQMVKDGARAAVLGGRTLEKAEQLAAALGGRSAPLEALRTEMERVDVVISGTGAPGLVVHRDDVEAAQAARRHRPLFLIDIAVPRDIEPSRRQRAGRLPLRHRRPEVGVGGEPPGAPEGGGRCRGHPWIRRSGSFSTGATRSTWCRSSWSSAGVPRRSDGGRSEKARRRLGPFDARAGEGRRRPDERDRQQAPPFAHGAP